MKKLTWGQTAVLTATVAPMVVTGALGAVATFVNTDRILHSSATALGVVAAGEGATLICALVTIALTLMGQHTPSAVRLGLWLMPVTASAAGCYLAPDGPMAAVMTLTPMAMTAAGEGSALVARRVVAYRSGTDLEQQRRSGLLLWHANRAAHGSWAARRISRAAVWRLTRQFAATDSQISVQLGEIQRYRISEGADANLAALLSGGRSSTSPVQIPQVSGSDNVSANAVSAVADVPVLAPEPPAADYGFLKEALAEAGETVARDPSVKLLTVAEVAELKGVKASSVRSWTHRGKLPVFSRDAEGRALYHPVDVQGADH